MLLILLILGCDRSTCESKTLTKLAEGQCEAWMACPEFAPGIPAMYDSLDSCVDAQTIRHREWCQRRTSEPCNGELVPAKVMDCATLYKGSARDCEMEPSCEYVDTGGNDNGIYQNVSLECVFITE